MRVMVFACRDAVKLGENLWYVDGTLKRQTGSHKEQSKRSIALVLGRRSTAAAVEGMKVNLMYLVARPKKLGLLEDVGVPKEVKG